MKKQIEVELDGRLIILMERSARQVFAFTEFANEQVDDDEHQGQEPDYVRAIYTNALILSDAAKAHVETLPRWKYFQKRRILRHTTTGRIIEVMTPREMAEMAIDFLVQCEGLNPDDLEIDVKKKTVPEVIVEKESASK